MKIILTVNEIKKMDFIENTFNRMLVKSFKVNFLTTSTIAKKVEEANKMLEKNTTAIRIDFDRNTDTVTIDIDENLMIDIMSTFGDLTKAIVGLVFSYKSNFDTIIHKYSTKEFIEKEEKNEKKAEISSLRKRLTELGV